jgi:hypothetical protein
VFRALNFTTPEAANESMNLIRNCLAILGNDAVYAYRSKAEVGLLPAHTYVQIMSPEQFNDVCGSIPLHGLAYVSGGKSNQMTLSKFMKLRSGLIRYAGTWRGEGECPDGILDDRFVLPYVDDLHCLDEFANLRLVFSSQIINAWEQKMPPLSLYTLGVSKRFKNPDAPVRTVQVLGGAGGTGKSTCVICLEIIFIGTTTRLVAHDMTKPFTGECSPIVF